jgi:pimeloyl-ACP methyl ester carboxylesterase
MKQHLLLLHGAIGSKQQLQELADILEHKYIVHTISFSAHGGTSISNEPFSIELFAQEVLSYLEEKNITQTTVFGYSMGGYVALYLAKHFPQKINKVITLATKFHWDEEIAAKEIKMLDADLIQKKLPAFAQQLQERHAPQDWRVVLEKTKEMMVGLGKKNPLQLKDYANVEAPCLLLLGDRDKMISMEETINVYKQFPNAQFGMLPDTPHPIEQVDVNTLSFFITRFCYS